MACTDITIIENPEISLGENNVGAYETVWQTIQVPTQTTVCGVSVYGGYGGGSEGVFRIDITDNGNAIATTGQLDMSAWGQSYTTPAYTDFIFETPVTLEANTTYRIDIVTGAGSVNDIYRFGYGDDNTYTDGQLIYGEAYDMLFKVYGTEVVVPTETIATPIITTLNLVLIAFVMYGSYKLIRAVLPKV